MGLGAIPNHCCNDDGQRAARFRVVTDAAGAWSIDYAAAGFVEVQFVAVQPLGERLLSELVSVTTGHAQGRVLSFPLTDLPGRRRKPRPGVTVYIEIVGA